MVMLGFIPESEIRELLVNSGFNGFEWKQISMSAFIVTAFKNGIIVLLFFTLIFINYY